MKHIAALALLFACGSYDATYFETPDAGELRAAAAQAWADSGVDAPSDYTLILLPQAELPNACDTAPTLAVGACTLPVERVVFLAQDQSAEQQLMNLTHELGHLMQDPAHQTHLDCPEADGMDRPGSDVMCLTAAPLGTPPTSRDAAFVSSL